MTLAADAVLDLIRRSDLSKSEVSRRSGVSRALIDDYLKGRRQPSVAQLERLGESVGLRVDIVWSDEVELDTKPTPHWARPHPDMDPQPLTIAQRAKVIELVCALAMEMPARERGELEFPPFRQLRAR